MTATAADNLCEQPTERGADANASPSVTHLPDAPENRYLGHDRICPTQRSAYPNPTIMARASCLGADRVSTRPPALGAAGPR